MGNRQSFLSEEEIQNYLDTTFLSRKEVIRVVNRFIQLAPDIKKTDPDVHDKLMNMKLPYSQLTKCPELKENPFRKRICKIFSSDGLGDLTFNEFMLLFSSLCEHAPRDIKLHYAFSIYDFDGDKYIGVADIEQALRMLTQGQLTDEETEQVWKKVLEETDIDDDKKLSSNEFSHVINKSPDFLTTFNIRI